MEYDVLGGYMPLLVDHLKDTSTRLGLGMESAYEDRDASPPDWTPAEHNAFFRALAVHSRWRPDLIAACIPTKTEWEVWMYLEALEEGVAALDAQQGSDVDVADAEMAVGAESGMDDEGCEPALEVSQAWIDVEERMAAWIVQQECLASVEEEDVEAEDVERESRKRKRGRGQNRVRGQTVSSESRYSLTSDHRSPSASARQLSVSPTREREALMGRLESAHLSVLDGILRGEEATKGKSKHREDSVTGAIPTQYEDQAEHERSSNRISTAQQTSDVSGATSNIAIDPILLALSGGVDPIGGQAPSENTSETRAASHMLPNAASHFSFSQPEPSNIFVFPVDDTTHTNADTPEDADPGVSVLSPRSRRRIQKRLYMRRKRAMLREDDVVDTGIQKLKPGKKAKLARADSETPVISELIPGSEAPSEDEGEPGENVPKKNKGGLTLPYKLKAQFGELGVDAAYLRSQGMDLLNLGALGRLMGLHASLELEEEVDIVESIDAQLIQHLQAAMVAFVTDIIHRAIVWREREIRLKSRCQAWRQGDQITIGAIEHGVEAAGARYHSHKEYLKALEVLHGLSTELSNSEEPSHTDPEVEAAVLSPYREGHTPLIRPPAMWKMGPLVCLSRTYEREAMRTRRGPSAELDEDELMGESTDEEALGGELEEEEARDEMDMEEGEMEETGLWELVKR